MVEVIDKIAAIFLVVCYLAGVVIMLKNIRR